MKYEIYNKTDIKNIYPVESNIIISIADNNKNRLTLNIENCVDVLYLNFLDVDTFHDKATGVVYLNAFSTLHAISILKFYSKYKNSVNLIIANCVEGVSRSSAIIAALDEIENSGNSFIFNNNLYKPNLYVYNIIKKVWNSLFKINNGNYIVDDNMIEELRKFLKPEGIDYFRELKQYYGKINVVIPPHQYLNDTSIPYSVHLYDGMQIRNFLRTKFDIFNKILDIDIIDSIWIDVVNMAIGEDTP